MSFIRRRIINKIINNDNSPIISRNKLEKDYNTLKENLLHGQGLVKIGSWTYDILNEEIYWSNEIYSILESSPKDSNLYLEDFYSYIHPDNVDEVKNAVDRSMAGKEYDIEYRIITSSGTEKYIHEKTKTLYDDEKRPMKIIGTIQDITREKLLENDLRTLGMDLSSAQKVAGIGSWKYDVKKDEIFWSQEAYKIHNIDPENFEKTWKSLLQLINPEDRLYMENALKDCLEGEPYKLNYRTLQVNGEEKHIEAKGEPIFNNEGRVVGIIGTIQDVTEKRELEKKINLKQQEIEKAQRKFQVLVQESNDVFQIIDADGTIKYTSGSIEKIIGHSSKELEGKNIYNFFKGQELKKLGKIIDFVLKEPGKRIQEDIVYKHTDGRKFYLEMRMQNLFNEPTIKGIVLNFRDVTKRIQMEKEIAYKATHDELTGLPNSIYCSKKLRDLCKYASTKKTKFALMMLDIRGIKYINYTLGYEYGDQLVIKIVERLKKFLAHDVFISHYSQHHFAIIIQGRKGLEDYEKIAREIIKLLIQSYKIERYELDITANIGISIFPKDALDMESIRSKSKVALMRAKKEGKNIYKLYASDIDVEGYKELVLRSDLNKAIEKNQFRVYYQPIVNLKDGKILGAEALIRWEHPEWGMVPPNEFIYLAEESGTIINIGKWVLRRVCKDYKNWKGKGLPDIKVSVNFSGIELLEKDLVENVKSSIVEYQLDPKFLIMEITEGILIENSKKAVSDIKKLQSYGIQVAIDDFGTGFSSFLSLHSFNTDIIKIDKAFVKDVPGNGINTSVIKSIFDLSREVKIKLIAEGIEDWDQLNFLRNLNCNVGQGYLFSKPIPLVDFEKVLAKGRCKPTLTEDTSKLLFKERRKFFRIEFMQLLEANLTILELRGKKLNVGNTKVLIKNIGPGGLCFISDIRFPLEKDIILQYTTELLGEKTIVYGKPVWIKEMNYDLFQYGVKFTIDENERVGLIGKLNQIQIKLRKNELFTEGRFISGTYLQYFSPQEIRYETDN